MRDKAPVIALVIVLATLATYRTCSAQAVPCIPVGDQVTAPVTETTTVWSAWFSHPLHAWLESVCRSTREAIVAARHIATHEAPQRAVDNAAVLVTRRNGR
jgi:hypothetical protein